MPMVSGEGSLSGGNAAAAATATGPQVPLKRYPAKRKAKKEAQAAGPHGSSKGRKAAKDLASRRMPRPRANRGKAARDVEDEAAAEASGTTGFEKYRRLSKADIRWILTLKPLKPPARFAALKRSNPELTPQPGEEADEEKRRLYSMAKAFFEMEEGLPRTQEWVRSQLREKGYVELDEESARRRAEVQAVIDREWPAIEEKMQALILSEKEDKGSGESDSDEGEGSDKSEYEEEDGFYY